MCQRDSRCGWSVTQSPAACGPAECTYFNFDEATAEAMCSSKPACQWQTAKENHFKDMCVQKRCDLMDSSCNCASLPGCVWRNEQCKDNRFVQCPGIDVVFLIEGSSVMLEDFGRHPNGYVGIVESIRSWSKQAPFAITPENTGFRLAMVTYGQPRRALTLPSNIGGGGNLTGDPNQWLGYNQALDYFEEHVSDYATSGNNGEAAIKPALQAAIQSFQNDEAPNRNKMVVILGHSPISDGDNGLNKEINQLESMGVQIFANVLRRFSYVTDPDKHSAKFMRPLASDPASAHFLFTTVDDMKENLLENFCDPSSGPGKVLEISRDRELPCPWLDGKTECEIQGACSWTNETFECTKSGECPNLECKSLPSALIKAGYECKHCR